MSTRNTVAVLDACVLYSSVARDLLLWLAKFKFFQPKWSSSIHDEWTRNLLANRPDIKQDQVDWTIGQMETSFPDALIGEKIEMLNASLPDEKDLHVLQAAVACRADVIVTFNLRDFPTSDLSKFFLEAKHPDTFCCDLMKVDRKTALIAFEKQVDNLEQPRLTFIDVLDNLARSGMPRSASLLHELVKHRPR
ncbi:MAG: PIN domain-containing protein [Bacteroidota bacterium]